MRRGYFARVGVELPVLRRRTDFDQVSGYGFVGHTYQHRAPMNVRPLSPSPKKRKRWIKAYMAGLGVVWMLAASGILPSLYGEPVSDADKTAIAVAQAAPAETRWVSPGPSIKPLDIARSSRAAMLSVTAGAPDAFGQKTYALFVATEVDEAPVDVASIETETVEIASIAATESRFDRVAKEARLSSSQVASILKRARKAPASDPVAVARAIDAAKKQLAEPKPAEEEFMPVLAFASPSPTSDDGALAAVSAMAANRGELARELEAEGADEGDEAAAVDEEIIVTPVAPEFAELPDAVHAPAARPKIDDATRALLQAKKPAKEQKEEGTQVVALAKPDNVLKKTDEAPKKSGSWFGFGRSHPKAGNGVAVYDISAATVYMPDGTTLEAHSGIGHMADNPDFVHVKMNGPTPPHTYNLRMREKRFHGVEAIRMLPVDGKNKHGRDGFLTHSYLLRGARLGQSHGCVAFKDYDKFLNAFKAGKVRQIIVVPGNGKGSSKKRKEPAVAEAAGGRDA